MHLYINQSTKQVIFFSKNQPVIRNWMRGQIYVLVNSTSFLVDPLEFPYALSSMPLEIVWIAYYDMAALEVS